MFEFQFRKEKRKSKKMYFLTYLVNYPYSQRLLHLSASLVQTKISKTLMDGLTVNLI